MELLPRPGAVGPGLPAEEGRERGGGRGERILPAGEGGGERAGFGAVSWDRREQGLGGSGDVSEAQWGSVRPPPGAFYLLSANAVRGRKKPLCCPTFSGEKM